MRGRVPLPSAEGASGRIRLCRAEDAGQAEGVRVPLDHSPGGAGEGVPGSASGSMGRWMRGRGGRPGCESGLQRREEVGTDGVDKGAVGSAWLPGGPRGRSKAPHTLAGAERRG